VTVPDQCPPWPTFADSSRTSREVRERPENDLANTAVRGKKGGAPLLNGRWYRVRQPFAAWTTCFRTGMIA
jgi:hypothetical protein